jgi:hypothetical protein
MAPTKAVKVAGAEIGRLAQTGFVAWMGGGAALEAGKEATVGAYAVAEPKVLSTVSALDASSAVPHWSHFKAALST